MERSWGVGKKLWMDGEGVGTAGRHNGDVPQWVHLAPPEMLTGLPHDCHFTDGGLEAPGNWVVRIRPGAGCHFSPAPPHTAVQCHDSHFCCPQTLAGAALG